MHISISARRPPRRRRRCSDRPSSPRAALVALTCAVSLCAASCSLVPDYLRPDEPAPDAWTTQLERSGQSRTAVDRTWWQGFESGELTTLIQRGLDANYNLAVAVSRIDEARAQAAIDGAPLYPTLDANADVTRGTGIKSPRSQQAVFTASYELDFWGKNRATADAADALAAATVFDRDTVALTLTSDIANTYFQILSLRERLRIARSVADDAQRTYDLLKLQVAAGITSDLELEQQRNTLAVFRANVPALEQQLEQAQHALAALLGARPGELAIEGMDFASVTIPVPDPGLPSELVQRRPDIQSAETRLIASNFDIGAARSAFFPRFPLTATGGVTSDSLSDFFPAKELVSVGATVTQPLFHGGALQGQLDLSKARNRELAAGYRQTIITAFQDVENALTAVNRLSEQEAITSEAVDAARRASELANARLQFGTVNVLTVLDTQRQRFQAEDTLMQVHLGRLQAAVALYRALGGGFDYRCAAKDHTKDEGPTGCVATAAYHDR